MVVCLTLEDVYTMGWSTQLLIALHLKQRPPSSSVCVELKSARFATAVVSHALRYSLTFTGTSLLPISTQPPSLQRGLLVSYDNIISIYVIWYNNILHYIYVKIAYNANIIVFLLWWRHVPKGQDWWAGLSCATWGSMAGADIPAHGLKGKACCSPRHLLESKLPKGDTRFLSVVNASAQTLACNWKDIMSRLPGDWLRRTRYRAHLTLMTGCFSFLRWHLWCELPFVFILLT